MFVSTANLTDRNGALCMICCNLQNLSKVLKVMADGGYTGEKFADGVRLLIDAEVEIVKRNELHSFKVLPKRWIVERCFAWLDKCRRLWKNCERHFFVQRADLSDFQGPDQYGRAAAKIIYYLPRRPNTPNNY